MLLTELLELLRHGESSGVEFKRDDLHPDNLTTEVAARANLEGGHILLGVEDDGTVSGLTRAPKEVEEWVMNVCRDRLQKDYATRERASLRGPITPLLAPSGDLLERGLVEQGIDFVRRNTAVDAMLDAGGRRHERWADYPLEAVRETIVNALAHRDYSIVVTDIELSLYEDRLEAISPGRLLNTITVERVRQGSRATRNELIKDVLRDYRYVEATGLGAPRKIICGMCEHNGTDPDLVEEKTRFIVRLWRTSAG